MASMLMRLPASAPDAASSSRSKGIAMISIGFVGHRALPEHQIVGGRIGRDQMQRRLHHAHGHRLRLEVLPSMAILAHCGRQSVRPRSSGSMRRTGPVRSGSSPPLEPVGAGECHSGTLAARRRKSRCLLPPQDNVVIVVAGRH